MINGHTDYQDVLPGSNTPAADPLEIPAFLRRHTGADMKPSPHLSPEAAHKAAEAMKAETYTPAPEPEENAPTGQPDAPDPDFVVEGPPTLAQLEEAIRKLDVAIKQRVEQKRILKKQYIKLVQAL